MVSEAIFVGATVAGAAPNAAEFFGPVKVPGTMSKESTIVAHRQKVREARHEHMLLAPCAFAGSVCPNDGKYDNCAHRPMVGVLTSVVVINQDRSVLYQQTAKPPVEHGKVALPFINFLKETYPTQFADSLRHGDANPSVIVFGFNIKQILRIAAFEVLGYNARGPAFERTKLPVRLWYNPAGVYDPLDVLLSAADQRDLDLYSILRYLGIQVTSNELSSCSQTQARTLVTLVERSQLIPMLAGS